MFVKSSGIYKGAQAFVISYGDDGHEKNMEGKHDGKN